MFMAVQTVDLFLFGHPQANELLDQAEDDEHADQNPGRHADQAQGLHTQAGKTAAVEHTAVGGKQAHSQGAPGTVDAVDRHGAHGVVDAGDAVKEFHREDAQHTGHNTDDGGAVGVHLIAAGGDGHQAGQRAVEGQGHIRLAVAQPGDDKGGHGGQGRRQVGVEADQAGGDHGFVTGHGDGGAAVEAEPAEPQDKDAQRHGCHVVAGNSPGLAVLVVLADTGAQHPGAQHGGDAAHEMHGGGTGEIMEAQLGQPAAAPDPVTGDGVNDQADGCRIQAVSAELGALGHGAGHDGGGGGAEHRLEHHIHPHRQAAEIVAAPDEGVKAPDERSGPCKHHPEAYQPVAGRADTKVHHVFHQDVARVLGTGQARLAQSEPRLHEKDHKRRYQRPGHVCGIVHNSCLPSCMFKPKNEKRRTVDYRPAPLPLLCCPHASTALPPGQEFLFTLRSSLLLFLGQKARFSTILVQNC